VIKLPKPTPPPEVLNHNLLLVPYLYVVSLIFLAVWQLIMFPGFMEYIAGYFGGKATALSITTAILLVSLEVFAAPFLMRLRLSPLARMCSAICALLVPIMWSAVTMGMQQITSPYVVANFVFIVWAATSFWVLGGQQALKVKV
jgi:hypothetical protein